MEDAPDGGLWLGAGGGLFRVDATDPENAFRIDLRAIEATSVVAMRRVRENVYVVFGAPEVVQFGPEGRRTSFGPATSTPIAASDNGCIGVRLLVGLDGSPRARGVLEGAVAFGSRLGAKLVLVRASTIAGELPAEAYLSGPDAVDAVLRRLSMEDLGALAEGLEDFVEKIRVEQGPAWEVIDRVAREETADAIVIGAHGYGAIERVLGTVASRVVNHADRPVLVVRDAGRLR